MSQASTLEREMLDLINEERAAAGLDPLRLELRLNAASEDHSEWMLDADVFSHAGEGGSGAGDRMRDAGFVFSGSWAWGENVAWQSERGVPGLSDDVEGLHQALMNSPGHRANILNPNYEVVGIGVEQGDFRGWDAVMVTQNFARSSAPMQYDGGTAPAPEPQPEPNTAPVARLGDIELAAGEWRSVGARVSYSDADGDAAVRFQIRDPDGGRDVRIDGRAVDASAGVEFAAADLASLAVRAGAAGSTQTMQIRASDGEDWGPWDPFAVAARPEEADAPALAVDDFHLAPGGTAALADAIDFADPGLVRWLQIRDTIGDSNFTDESGREIFSRYGRFLPARQLDEIEVRADDAPSTQTLEVRAFVGREFTEWVEFELTTDWDAVA